MSTAWAGGTDAIVERMDQMTELFVEQTRRSIYTGESTTHCDECGEPIPEARRRAIACRYCLPCQTKLEQGGKI